jgi:hypothetical protein
MNSESWDVADIEKQEEVRRKTDCIKETQKFPALGVLFRVTTGPPVARSSTTSGSTFAFFLPANFTGLGLG